MPFLRKLVQHGPNWIPSLATYGAAAGLTLVYFTEWRIITENIPLYNLKYKEDE